MTYSIVARDAHTGQFGVAVQTHQLSVGRIVPWLTPGVGALATQSLSNVSFGPTGLALLAERVPAERVVAALVASDADEDRRQLAVVDAEGRAAAHTGARCIPHAGHVVGDGFSAQANMMTNPGVPEAMAAAFTAAQGGLAQRMVAALEAAQALDGDIRGMQSAALVVVPGGVVQPPEVHAWTTLYDLRVDESAEPVAALARLVRLREAQWVSGAGGSALDAGQREQALHLFAQARALAPDMVEVVFWQAVQLAEKGHTDDAAGLLHAAFDGHPRRDHWLDLLRRLPTVALYLTPEQAEALLALLS